MFFPRPNGSKLAVPLENVYTSGLTPGDVVTYSFELQLRGELPHNPKIYRKRIDLDWEDVVINSAEDQQYLNGMNRITEECLIYLAAYSKVENVKAPPAKHKHWTLGTMRDILEAIAKAFNKNPFIPETWYSIPYAALVKFKVFLFLMLLFCFVFVVDLVHI